MIDLTYLAYSTRQMREPKDRVPVCTLGTLPEMKEGRFVLVRDGMLRGPCLAVCVGGQWRPVLLGTPIG